MQELKSGKELCDDFFNNLQTRDDLDSKTAILLKKLYDKGNITKDKIIKGLESLRQEGKNEKQS